MTRRYAVLRVCLLFVCLFVFCNETGRNDVSANEIVRLFEKKRIQRNTRRHDQSKEIQVKSRGMKNIIHVSFVFFFNAVSPDMETRANPSPKRVGVKFRHLSLNLEHVPRFFSFAFYAAPVNSILSTDINMEALVENCGPVSFFLPLPDGGTR